MTVSRSSPFARFASAASNALGHPSALILALTLIVLWLVSGPIFGFSDTWQLVINTSTSVITFLMVFLIQSTQNRDAHAMQLKLDELIRAMEGAHLALLDIEELSDRELAAMRRRYTEIARHARERMRAGVADTGTPDAGFETTD